MSKETKVHYNEFNNNKIFAVYPIDKEITKDSRPIVAVGLKKAKALVAHLKELKAFVEEESENGK